MTTKTPKAKNLISFYKELQVLEEIEAHEAERERRRKWEKALENVLHEMHASYPDFDGKFSMRVHEALREFKNVR